MSKSSKHSMSSRASSDRSKNSRMSTESERKVIIRRYPAEPSEDEDNKKKDKKDSKKEKDKNKNDKKKDSQQQKNEKAMQKQRKKDRQERLARPNSRRLWSLWDEKGDLLPPDRRDKIKSALEDDYFLSPEQTEHYFQALGDSKGPWKEGSGGGAGGRKENDDKSKELRQRQKWLVNFSAQIAFRLCDYIAKGQKEMLVSNRLRSIADVVLERVAEILGEPKPTRTHPGRLARFMVAISDRIAVWIENAVYRADAEEAIEKTESDEHMKQEADKQYGY